MKPTLVSLLVIAGLVTLGFYPLPSGVSTSARIIPRNESPIYIDFGPNQLLAARVDQADLRISEYAHLVGSFAFEKGQRIDAKLTSDDFLFGREKQLEVLTIGAEDVHLFLGVEGPYWKADLNGNRLVDEDEIDPNAVGLVASNLDVGLAVMTPTNPVDCAVIRGSPSSCSMRASAARGRATAAQTASSRTGRRKRALSMILKVRNAALSPWSVKRGTPE